MIIGAHQNGECGNGPFAKRAPEGWRKPPQASLLGGANYCMNQGRAHLTASHDPFRSAASVQALPLRAQLCWQQGLSSNPGVVMASATLAPEPPPKEPVSRGLLSTFTRSPSRKHKPRPSSESIESVVPVPASRPTRVRPRPGPHRTTTAPDASVTLNGIKELPPQPGDARAQTPVEGNMDVTAFALADAIRPPAFKSMKRKDEVPDMPSLNGAQLAQNVAITAQFGLQNNPNTMYQHIHDMSSKRIATLEYMRKA